MKRSLWGIPAAVVVAVLLGASISGGPVIWAMLTLIAPLVMIMVFAGRGAAHASADMRALSFADRLGYDRPRREGRSDKPVVVPPGTPEVRRAARLRRSEQIARAAAEEYAQAHADD